MKSVLRILIILAVIAVIITFATIWPSYTAYRTRGYNAMARNDLRQFYIAAQAYFQQNYDKAIDVESARKYGFTPTPDVILEIKRGQQMNFSVIASHPNGTDVYAINDQGEICTIDSIPHR